MRFADHIKKSQGFTMVELMVAMLLSLFLLGGILSVYLTGKQTYRSTQGLSQIQSNLRFTMDMFSRDIRMAGYMPCRYQPNLSTVINGNNWWQNIFDQPLQGYEGGVSTFPTDVTATEVLAPGSDAIAVFKTDGFQATVTSFAQSATSGTISVANPIPAGTLSQGETAIICDSHQAALFQISDRGANSVQYDASGNTAPGNCLAGLGSNGAGEVTCSDQTNYLAYDFPANNSLLVRYSPVIYYVAESDENPGVLALKRLFFQARDVGGTETAVMWQEELLQGVESMQIRYGVDTGVNQVANRFLDANQIDSGYDWNDVVTIKLGLLLVSGEEVTTQLDTKTYNLAGELIAASGTGLTHPQDRKMRQVANYTISLRNRVRAGAIAGAANNGNGNDDDDDSDDGNTGIQNTPYPTPPTGPTLGNG